MSAQANTEPSKLDSLKWIVAFAILFGGIYAFNVLAEESILIRAGIVIASVVIAIAVAMMTAKVIRRVQVGSVMFGSGWYFS